VNACVYWGLEQVDLRPDESRSIMMRVDPRLLAHYDVNAALWHITTGTYQVGLGKAADNLVLKAETSLTGRYFGE
jgi:beta-glucosidase